MTYLPLTKAERARIRSVTGDGYYASEIKRLCDDLDIAEAERDRLELAAARAIGNARLTVSGAVEDLCDGYKSAKASDAKNWALILRLRDILRMQTLGDITEKAAEVMRDAADLAATKSKLEAAEKRAAVAELELAEVNGALRDLIWILADKATGPRYSADVIAEVQRRQVAGGLPPFAPEVIARVQGLVTGNETNQAIGESRPSIGTNTPNGG